MGLRGPRGELAEIKIKKGNPGNRPIPPDNIKATGEPFVADFLSPDAKALVELIIEYQDPSVYKKIDGFALAAYATQWEVFVQATKARKKRKLLAAGSTGQEVADPLLKEQRDAIKMMMSLGDRLGLDPKARQALSVKAENKEVSKWEGLLGGKPN